MSNVFDFGATGDGVTDDTGAIQHAIAAGGGDITFLKGTYRITSTLVVDLAQTGPLSLRGLGGLARIINAGPGPALLIKGTHTGSADPKSFKPEGWIRERMPTVDGLEIEGAHPEADGIRIEGVMQPTLTRLLLRKLRTGIHITNRARNVLIDACHIYFNTGIGIHLDHLNMHQCIISASHISYCRLGGIRIDGGEIRNLQITGNDIEYNNARGHGQPFADQNSVPTAEIYIDVREGPVREGTICSNTIQATVSPNGSNIRLIGSERQNDQFGLWTISGNLIGNQECNIHATRAWGLVITGNQIYGAKRRNILIEDSRQVTIGANRIGHCYDFEKLKLVTGIRLENSTDCSLTGVGIQDTQIAPKETMPAIPEGREALVELVKCTRISMTGCQILEGFPIGLLVADCNDTLINACQIIDHREERLMQSGVEIRGETKNVVLSQCQILGATKEPIVGTPNPGLTMSNNVTGGN